MEDGVGDGGGAGLGLRGALGVRQDPREHKGARQYVREILRNEDDAQAYGGANPEAVRRWGVGQNSATDFGP